MTKRIQKISNNKDINQMTFWEHLEEFRSIVLKAIVLMVAFGIIAFIFIIGTLGCINDMLQRDKENRELRKLSRERLKETRNRLMKIGSSTKLPDTSVEEMKEIRKKTIEKEKADANHLSKIKLLLAIFVLFVLLSVWMFYSLIG